MLEVVTSRETGRARVSAWKAALKTPQSKRYRACQSQPDVAKRLDCGVFSAAFAGWFKPGKL